MGVVRRLKGNRLKHYALYKKGMIVFTGTAEEVAKYQGIKVDTVYFMASSAFHKRVEKLKDPDNAEVIYSLEEDDC